MKLKHLKILNRWFYISTVVNNKTAQFIMKHANRKLVLRYADGDNLRMDLLRFWRLTNIVER